MVGWLEVLGWQTAAIFVACLTGKQILAVVKLWLPSYISETWHDLFITWGLLAFALICNIWFSDKLPWVDGIVVIFHFAGLFVVTVPLWVMGSRASPEVVLPTFEDNMGWGSRTLAAVVGLIGPAACFIGSDAPVHMSGDFPGLVPQAMMWTWLGNGLMGLLMAVTFAFCLKDTSSLLQTTVSSQHVQMFFETTGSVPVTIGLTGITFVIGLSACVAIVARSSRQVYNFARSTTVQSLPSTQQVSRGYSTAKAIPATYINRIRRMEWGTILQ